MDYGRDEAAGAAARPAGRRQAKVRALRKACSTERVGEWAAAVTRIAVAPDWIAAWGPRANDTTVLVSDYVAFAEC